MKAKAIAAAVAVLLAAGMAQGGPHVNPADEFVVSAMPDMLQYNVRVWNDTVLWTDTIKGDIWAKNMATGETFFVGEHFGGYFDIHDDIVVWNDPSPTVWAMDLESRATTIVASKGAGPDVYDGLVVWRGDGTFLTDLASGIETSIPGVTQAQLWGDSIIWAANGLNGRKLSSGVTFTITTTYYGSEHLQGDIVVWRDHRNFDTSYLDIYAADISDPNNVVEFPICTAPGEQGAASVFGNVVVWSDYRNGDTDIYGYDIATGTEFPIATGPGNQFSPAIYENLVVWSNELGGQTNIHGNYIIPEPATLSLLALGGLAVLRRRR